VKVTTDAGSVLAVVELDDGVRPGVVSLPHGFGHGQPGTRVAVANARPGPNTNVLIPPDALDVPSGNAAVNGVPVRLTPA
jgi:anaerobic selenocysteine-containing dehydrogenase